MHNVYIVSTPYHLFISIVKTILIGRIGKDVVIVMYKSQIAPYIIDNAKYIFSKIYICERSAIISNLLCMKYNLSFIPYFSSLIKDKYGFDASYFSRNNIYIFNDNSYFGCLFNFWKIEYNLIEDALNIYKVEPRAYNQHNKLYNLFGLSWKSFGQSTYVKTIEVNDSNGIHTNHPNIIVNNRERMFRSLSKSDLELIAKIFDIHRLNIPLNQESSLLLTQPLSEDKTTSHAKKIKIYKHLVDKYAVGKLYIKAHPREKEDYSKIFPNAIILGNSLVPFEVYLLMENFKFKRAITTFSAVIDTITCAEEKISMGIEWTKNFK